MSIMTERERLPRTLGLWSSVALVVGITIGSGIFRSPAGIARQAPNPLAMLGLWVGGGVITLCGALSLAEIAASLPQTGGIYAYLREAWGRRAAFLFGWSELILIRASALGGIAVVFGEYLLRSLGIDPSEHVLMARALSASAIVFAAAANIRGANVGALIVGIATWAKFGALSLLVVAAFALGQWHGARLALIAIYVLTNLAYLYVLPIETIGHSPLVAADAMLALFGRAGVALVSV